MLQEPYIKNNKVSGILPSFKLLRGTNKKFRACIIADSKVNIWMLNQYSDADQVAAQVKIKNKCIVIASVYLPYDPKVMPPSDSMKQLVKYCKDSKFELIISTDANSQHITWGSTKCNNRGESLLNFIVSNDLFILNKGKRPTFSVPHRQEVIDLTLATHGIADRVLN